MHFVGPLVIQLDAGDPITVLGACTFGCYELFGTDRVRTIRDLKGKTVAITELGLTQHVFLSSMVAHVGLDPRKDVNFVEHPAAEASGSSRRERSTPTSVFAPDPQELRARKVGHVVVNSAVDRPWSQYFLLPRHGSPRVRPQTSGRDQAGAAGDPERGRPLRPRT